MLVKLTTPSPDWPLLLQTPGGEGMWDGVLFTTDPSCDEADAWVARYRRVLETGEPAQFERTLETTGRHLELAAFRLEPPERRQVAVLFREERRGK